MRQSVDKTTPSLHLGYEYDRNSEGYWPITQPLVIGRESADITIALPVLSRRHAQVSQRGGAWQIQDLDSKNGTAVNGTMLAVDPHWLRHGDSIVLGGVVELKFHDPQATPISPRLGKLQGLWIDTDNQEIWIDAQRLSPPLSIKQISLLRIIASANGKVVTKTELINRVWPLQTAGTVSTDTLDSLIKRLRGRLASIENGKPILEVVRGQGVRLKQNR